MFIFKTLTYINLIIMLFRIMSEYRNLETLFEFLPITWIIMFFWHHFEIPLALERINRANRGIPVLHVTVENRMMSIYNENS